MPGQQLPLSTLWELAYARSAQQAEIERNKPLAADDWRMQWALQHLPRTDERVLRAKWVAINPNIPFPGDEQEVQA